ncbi:MAG: hypothetical protein ACP5SB_03180 [Caldisericaceae bacterium]
MEGIRASEEEKTSLKNLPIEHRKVMPILDVARGFFSFLSVSRIGSIS